MAIKIQSGYRGPFLFETITFGFANFVAHVNECNQNPCPSDGVCHNTVGGHKCSCRAGKKYGKESNTCNPDTNLIIGNIPGNVTT